MRTINVRETREKLSSLLDAVAAGEDIVILRHGKPAARLTHPWPEQVRFPDRSELRASMPACEDRVAGIIRILRDEERY